MSPERAAERDAVLSGLEAGEDQGDLSKVPRGGKKDPKKAGRSSSARDGDDRPNVSAKGKRPIVADPDDPANDELDLDEELEEGIVGEDPPKRKKAPARDLDDDDDDDPDEDTDDDDDDDERGLKPDNDPDDEDDDEDADEDEDDEDTDVGSAKKRIAALERKSLARIAETERRAKERDRERRLEAEQREAAFVRKWEPQIEDAKKVLAIRDHAKRSPIEATIDFAREVAGIQGEDWELSAKAFFRHSPRALNDPKAREAGMRAQADLETKSELAKVQADLARLREETAAREQAEANQRTVKAFLDSASNAVTAETRLVRRMLKRNPERARAQLREVAVEHLRKTGLAPSPAKVVRLLEKRERGRLLELGIDPASLFKQKKGQGEETNAPKQKQKTGSKTKAGKTPQNGQKLTGRALRDEVESELGRMTFK
jgi:hypothetical protein